MKEFGSDMEKKELKLNIAISECACKNYIVHLSCHVLQQQLLFFKTVHVKVKFILEKKKKIYQSLVGQFLKYILRHQAISVSLSWF